MVPSRQTFSSRERTHTLGGYTVASKEAISSGQETGPSWWDVQQQWFHIEAVYECKVTITCSLARAVDGKLGQYLQASVDGVAVQGIGGGFGRAYGSGPKTMPGALSRLLWAVEDRIEEQRMKAALLTQATLEEMIAQAGGTPA